MQKARILIVDDEEIVRKSLKDYLRDAGYEVDVVEDAHGAINLLREREFNVLIADLKLPDMDGIELMREAKKFLPHLQTIIITAYGSIQSAVLAIKQGAYDYIEKPFPPEKLEILIDRALQFQQLQEENIKLHRQLRKAFQKADIIGKSPRMQEVFRLIDIVANTAATVLIEGESGTGKELVARAIWSSGDRRDKPFVAVDCATLPETLIASELFGYEKGAFTGATFRKIGKFEYADGGTLFLDEVGNIPFNLQHYLLRVLQEKEFTRVGGNKPIKIDLRIIAATSKNLREEVKRGLFREDLYYRLNVVNIRLPPLRERKEDIPILVQHFIKKYCIEHKKDITGVSEDVMNIFLKYPWPGNVRELENAIERAVLLCKAKEITTADIPEYIMSPEFEIRLLHNNCLLTLEEMQRQYISFVLKSTGNNISRAAKILGIQRNTLRNKINQYNLKSSSF